MAFMDCSRDRMERENMAFDDMYIPEPNSGCWIWIRAINGGYGNYAVSRKAVRAHRYAYEREFGKIPEGLELDHLCRNTFCVNPQHLQAVTHRVNSLRGIGVGAINSKKTHCPQGHEYTAENMYLQNGGRLRRCRECTLARGRMRYHAIKSGARKVQTRKAP